MVKSGLPVKQAVGLPLSMRHLLRRVSCSLRETWPVLLLHRLFLVWRRRLLLFTATTSPRSPVLFLLTLTCGQTSWGSPQHSRRPHTHMPGLISQGSLSSSRPQLTLMTLLTSSVVSSLGLASVLALLILRPSFEATALGLFRLQEVAGAEAGRQSMRLSLSRVLQRLHPRQR